MAGVNARADYSYTATNVTGGGTISGTFSDSVTPNTQAISGNGAGAQTFVTITYSNIPTTPVGPISQTITWVETLNSTVGGSTSLVVNPITLVLSISASGGTVNTTVTSFTPTTASSAGGPPNGFTISSPQYSPTPGTNNPALVGYTVSPPFVPSGVPEPASVVMLGSGLVGVIGFSLRRNKKPVSA